MAEIGIIIMINNERLLKRFLDYVQVDSETGDEKLMVERVIADLTAAGFTATQDDVGAKINSTGNNVYCYYEGDSSAEPLFFSGHMDTVVPGIGVKPKVENGIIKSDGTTVLGGDDKCAIASMVEAIITVKEQDVAHRPIELVFTVREESGLHGSANFDTSVLKSKAGVILDSGGKCGQIVVSAPGQVKVNAEIIGVPSHAGIAPEKGVSAIMVAAEAISNMKLLRIDEETTANIGTLKAESPTNIVAEKAIFVAEARSLNYDKLIAQKEHMQKCLQDACDKFGATLVCDAPISYVGYTTDENSPILKTVKTACEKLGCPVTCVPSGGGSDANNFRRSGLEVLNLGCGMAKVHSKNEELAVSDLEQAAQLVFELMKA